MNAAAKKHKLTCKQLYNLRRLKIKHEGQAAESMFKIDCSPEQLLTRHKVVTSMMHRFIRQYINDVNVALEHDSSDESDSD